MLDKGAVQHVDYDGNTLDKGAVQYANNVRPIDSPITQLSAMAVSGRRYGSFAGKSSGNRRRRVLIAGAA